MCTVSILVNALCVRFISYIPGMLEGGVRSDFIPALTDRPPSILAPRITRPSRYLTIFPSVRQVTYPHFRFRSAPEEKISEFYTKIKVMTGHLFSLKNAKMVKKKIHWLYIGIFKKMISVKKCLQKYILQWYVVAKNGKY